MSITAKVYLEFIENHLPALKAGEYRIHGHQVLEGTGVGDDDTFRLDLPEFRVKVAGERFAINPAEIVGVFPPDNSLGHYANVLPHVAFKRDTLPWERRLAMSLDEAAERRLKKAPWMALLVLNEDELRTDQGKPPESVDERQQAENGYVKTHGDLAEEGAHWPPHLDPDEHPDERFKVVYVQKDTLKKLLPGAQALTWLAHARKSRIRLVGVQGGQQIEVHDDKGALIHQEAASGDDAGLDCGPLAAGAYTIKVDGKEIADQPLRLKPSDQVGGEAAIVVANRLPPPGKKSVLHLVSLEGRYKQAGDDFAFDFDGYGEAVPLVSLYHWSFTALTERETFRHILLHLNHQFLFGINVKTKDGDPTRADLRPGFLAGRHPLGAHARIVDRAVKELRDKDHCYYLGEKGAIYDAAGRRVAAGKDEVPHDKKAAAVKARQLWIEDGPRRYFVGEDPPGSRRFLVYLLPGDATPSLRLPGREGKDSELANGFLQQGYVPLPHHFRRGGQSVSWYRGPLLAGKPGRQIPDEQFPVRTADELLRYDSTSGMFDTSYAAAWELGRLLCLRNKRLSLALYRWKRTHVRLLKAMEQQHLHPHLPFRAKDAGKIVLPEQVERWLSRISLLEGLPFGYLVPDERMLGAESLRFFCLDPSWVASLVDGALSIGRVDQAHDTAVHKQALADSAAVQSSDTVSGFLLRSSAVQGWPKLQVNAYDYRFQAGSDAVEDRKNEAISDGELPCLRLARLSDNVLLGLFSGDVKVLDIHERPETVHFGFDFDPEADTTSRYRKTPRRSDGTESDDVLIPGEDNVEDYFDEGMRIVRPDALADALKSVKDLGYGTFTSAQFALSLIEGVSRVRFIRDNG